MALFRPFGASVPYPLREAGVALNDTYIARTEGTLAARPAAGQAGRVYYATDILQRFYDNGTAWIPAGLATRVRGAGQGDTYVGSPDRVNFTTANTPPSTSVILGGTNGQPHTVSSDSSLLVIGGGYDNTINSANPIASTIAGGAHHIIDAAGGHAFIGGGSTNRVLGSYGVVAGGLSNSALGGYSVVGGGRSNTAGDAADPANITDSVVAGGYLNTATGDQAAIGGGFSNDASGDQAVIGGGNDNGATGDQSFVGGGNSNLATGLRDTVGGGNDNTAEGGNSVIAGGSGNWSSGATSSVLGGAANRALNAYSTVGGGLENRAEADYAAVLGGRHASAYLYGQQAHSAGQLSVRGDAQRSDLILRKQTTNNSWVPLRLDGAAANAVMPDRTAWHFRVRIVGVRSDVLGKASAFEFVGLIRRDAGAATTTIVGTVDKTVEKESDAATDARVTADTATGALFVEVRGISLETWRWAAHVQLVEASG